LDVKLTFTWVFASRSNPTATIAAAFRREYGSEPSCGQLRSRTLRVLRVRLWPGSGRLSGNRTDSAREPGEIAGAIAGTALAARRGMLRIIVGLILSSSFVRSPDVVAEPASPVVGGSRVPEGKWRDVVVVIAREGTCTGTLVAPDVVVTAGHCIEAGPIEVITDTVDHGVPYAGDRIRVKWARAYPRWWERYDVGVIMLDHVARGRARRVAAACTTRERLVAGGEVHVVGFGLVTPEGVGGNTAMHEATLRVTDPTCTSDLACNAEVAPHGEFVAGGDGRDTCFGDSGGPAYLDTPEGPALVGVVSRGRAPPGPICGGGGIYVRADKVVAWIQRVTGARLERTACPGRADDPREGSAGEPQGCAAGPGTGGCGMLGLLGVALMLVRSRRCRAGRVRRDRARTVHPARWQAMVVRPGSSRCYR
jgi:hypothetical protein